MEELQGRLSHAEFLSWIDFARHEPIGAQRLDVLAAMQMQLLATIHAGKRKPTLADFMPVWWDDEKPQPSLEQKFRRAAIVPQVDGWEAAA